MKEPDIKAVRNELGISDEHKFIGYIIIDCHESVFLSSYTGTTPAFLFMQWTALPELALKFDSYCKARKIVSHLEINEKAIVVMAFDLGMSVGILDIPPCFWKGN
ncbi:hypothetical protein AH715_005280 [Salmonella enterica subsp. enterica]|nr:hypothetical protein [Salmonella enterica subsp. enterica]